MSQKKNKLSIQKKSGQSDTHGKKNLPHQKTYMNKKQIKYKKKRKVLIKKKKEERTTFIGVLDRGKK